MEFEIGTLSIILIVGLLALISIGVPMGFASGFMGAVLVFLYIGCLLYTSDAADE